MTKAVYKLREDGDWDFVAAFDAEQIPEAPSNWPQEITDWLESEGETAKVIDADLNHLPDVLTEKSESEIYVAAFGQPVAAHIEKLTQDARGVSETVADARRSGVGAHERVFGSSETQAQNARISEGL